mmetsp:Transcript_10485/g.23834  ORF Transcript_10485/g.23834 Transcript_10485/m.23834 type:complete len:244 (-) Transcript_10485:206-937(-)
MLSGFVLQSSASLPSPVPPAGDASESPEAALQCFQPLALLPVTPLPCQWLGAPNNASGTGRTPKEASHAPPPMLYTATLPRVAVRVSSSHRTLPSSLPACLSASPPSDPSPLITHRTLPCSGRTRTPVPRMKLDPSHRGQQVIAHRPGRSRSSEPSTKCQSAQASAGSPAPTRLPRSTATALHRWEELHVGRRLFPQGWHAKQKLLPQMSFATQPAQHRLVSCGQGPANVLLVSAVIVPLGQS